MHGLPLHIHLCHHHDKPILHPPHSSTYIPPPVHAPITINLSPPNSNINHQQGVISESASYGICCGWRSVRFLSKITDIVHDEKIAQNQRKSHEEMQPPPKVGHQGQNFELVPSPVQFTTSHSSDCFFSNAFALWSWCYQWYETIHHGSGDNNGWNMRASLWVSWLLFCVQISRLTC